MTLTPPLQPSSVFIKAGKLTPRYLEETQTEFLHVVGNT